jgi:LuxR family maltose regulon positive regulatory protein
LIHQSGGQYLGAIGLEEVGIAALFCEWNDVEAAFVRVKQSLDYLPYWGKADDLCLAYISLSRIQLAQGNRTEAAGTIEKAAQLLQTCGVFSEARSVVEASQVNMWLLQGDWVAVDRWVATLEKRFGLHDPFRYEDELAHITQARVFMAQKKLAAAIRLLSHLEEAARSGGRMGRLIEIMIHKALALQAAGDTPQADIALTKSLALAEPEGYQRIFLDEGQPMQLLLVQWLAHEQVQDPAHAGSAPVREYAIHLLSQVDAEPHARISAQEKVFPAGDLVKPEARPATHLPVEAELRTAKAMPIEPLSPRELEVLQLMALGRTNQEIARLLIVAPGTVKAHTASIYRKLDAANRTEAVARARQLGILS